jgi:hypothetical protein
MMGAAKVAAAPLNSSAPPSAVNTWNVVMWGGYFLGLLFRPLFGEACFSGNCGPPPEIFGRMWSSSCTGRHSRFPPDCGPGRPDQPKERGASRPRAGPGEFPRATAVLVVPDRSPSPRLVAPGRRRRDATGPWRTLRPVCLSRNPVGTARSPQGAGCVSPPCGTGRVPASHRRASRADRSPRPRVVAPGRRRRDATGPWRTLRPVCLSRNPVSRNPVSSQIPPWPARAYFRDD